MRCFAIYGSLAFVAAAALSGCTAQTPTELSGRSPNDPPSEAQIQPDEVSPAKVVLDSAANRVSLLPVGPLAPRPEPLGNTAEPTPTADVTPVGSRSTTDRPDDSGDFQVHVLYVLPADAADEGLDTSGAIARSLGSSNAWLAAETGGQRFRLDTYQGVPDVTFFRCSKTHAQLGSSIDDRHAAIIDELQAAGFVSPNKVYTFFYGGGKSDPTKDTFVGGLGGDGFGGVLLKAFPDESLASTPEQAGAFEYTMLHETLHALGFAPACASHVTPDAHTNDDPSDILAATAGDGRPRLDPTHRNYFRANIANCSDLAYSPFLEPRPEKVQAPQGRPLTQDAGFNATPYTPIFNETNVLGAPELEDKVFLALDAARREAGLTSVSLDPTLRVAARRAGEPIGTEGWRSTLGAAGFAGPAEASLLTGNDPESLFTTFTASDDFKQLAADAGLVAVGVGASTKGGQTLLSVASTHGKLLLGAVSVGEGPLNTFTVATRLRARPGTTSTPGLIYVDEKPYVNPFTANESKDVTVYASVPRSGKHRVVVADITGDPAGNLDDQIFEVDGDRPVTAALRLN